LPADEVTRRVNRLMRQAAVLTPITARLRAATSAEIDIDTLEERLRRSFMETNGQMIGPMQLCGWVRV
jgi:hypothetical protein